MINNELEDFKELRTGKLVEFEPHRYGVFIQTESGKKLILTPTGDMIFDLENYNIKVVCSTAMSQCQFNTLNEIEERFDKGEFEGVLDSLKKYRAEN